MKTYIIFSIVVLLFFKSMFAQVGIDTDQPQELLHVAGSTNNVRVEGLGYPNNANNLGPGNTTRVYVNSLGNLVLGDWDDSANIFIDSGNYLRNEETPVNMVVQTGTGLGYSPVAVPTDWPNVVFTLTQNAILEVNYTVSWSIYDAMSLEKKRIFDNLSRVIHTGIYFIQVNDLSGPYKPSNVPVIYDADGNFINGKPWCIDPTSSESNCLNFAGLVGLNGQYYTNTNSEIGEFENLQTNGSDYVKLPPGTYAALFACKLEVESTQGTGAAKLWLGSGQDELQIRVYYYD